MAEFTRDSVQTVLYGAPVQLDTSIGCTKGYIIHRNGSGILTLRGIRGNGCFARYLLEFGANIALSEGATVGPIAVAIALDGEPLGTSKAIVTPAAVGDYFNVNCHAYITVPIGCCAYVSIENVSAGQQSIDIQNANFVATRVV